MLSIEIKLLNNNCQYIIIQRDRNMQYGGLILLKKKKIQRFFKQGEYKTMLINTANQIKR